MEGDALNSQEKAYFDYIKPDMPDEVAAMSLHRLTICVNRYYNKKAIILLDEYDTPLQEAYIRGYWDKMTTFIRSLFNNTFKTNPYMERGLMTGITRISKESIFSDINNLAVITTTSKPYARCFGFTEEEVYQALDCYGLSEWKEDVTAIWSLLLASEQSEPERFYQGFVLGLIVDLADDYRVTSNRESGLGRYDVMLEPLKKGKAATA